MATEKVGISTDTSLSLTSVMNGSNNTIPIDNLTPDHPTHGKLFPLWVASKFKDHKLEKFKKSDEDPCALDADEKRQTLKLHQSFLAKYLSYDSKLQNMLLYHGVGLGKSAATINYILTLHKHNPNWNVVILMKASLQRTWETELKQWLSDEEYKLIRKNIFLVNYNSSTAANVFLNNVMKQVNHSKKFLYIIEESHNFINNVFSNIVAERTGNAKKIYDFILNHRKEKVDTRILCLSATPIINHPFEIALTLNLLRSNTLPDTLSHFNDQFVSSSLTINPERLNQFNRRITGLVDYYKASPVGVYASKQLHTIDLEMSKEQYKIYKEAEDSERKNMSDTASILSGQSQTSSFKSATRQASNFVFPAVSSTIRGDKRPKSGQFNITDEENMAIMSGKNPVKQELTQTITDEKVTRQERYKLECDTFRLKTKEYFAKIRQQDIQTGITLMSDIERFTKSNLTFPQFHKEFESKSSKLYQELYACSPKMTAALFYLNKTPGKVLFYSSFVHMEGLNIFKLYLEMVGIAPFPTGVSNKTQLDDNIETTSYYVEYHGSVKAYRDEYMTAFNDANNIHGQQIKVMLLGPAATEGLSFTNIRQIHILEPHWNETLIEQVIGRGIRMCSHKELPQSERSVQIYKYKVIRPKKLKSFRGTTDEIIHNLSQSKQNLIESFLKEIRRSSVSCELFKNHNTATEKYSCFKVDDNIIDEEYPGAMYKNNITEDRKFDYGMFAQGRTRERIKTIRAKVSYSAFKSPKTVLLDLKTGNFYHPELHQIMGKIKKIPGRNDLLRDKDGNYCVEKYLPFD